MGLLQSIRGVFGGGGRAGDEGPPFPDDRPSIFKALAARREAAGEVYPLPEMELPDTERYEAASAGEARWAPGALDGVFSHHMGQGDASETVERLLAALERACGRPDQAGLLALHEAIPKDHILGAIDPLLGELPGSGVDPARLHVVARWLATESPDREPVKLGIALLGALSGFDDVDLFVTLGGHDEFALYSAVALRGWRDEDEIDRALWTMARMTRGWGRIQAIERMSEEPPPDVAGWLLREGYSNWIMHEYTARDCAAKGGLIAALRAPAPNGDLLDGAGEILATLTVGEPGPGMADYEDGAEAARLWVDAEASRAPDDLRVLRALRTLRDFARDADRDWPKLEPLGWTQEARRALAEAADRAIADPRWEALARRDLEVDDAEIFGRAADAAPEFGIDPWPHFFARQRDGRGEHWWHLMRTDDPARAAEVAELAEKRLDLAQLASGPALELGLGPAFQDASALDFVVGDLGRFPGVGAPLVLASLKSPVIRNRNFAVKALAAWPRDVWPPEGAAALATAIEAEPDAEVRGRMEAVRDGRKLEG